MHIDGFMNGVQINSQALSGLSLKEVISRLSPGDIVRAQILDFIANEVLLKLFDSTTVKATVPDDFEAEVGKFKNFVVKESLPDKLVLEEQKSIAQKAIKQDEEDIIKALVKIGLPDTDENIDIAKAVKENNMTLAKEIFENASKLLKSDKSIDIPKAIFMEANKIAADPVSIKQLGLLEKGSVSLGNQLNELISLLDESNISNNAQQIEDNNQQVKSLEASKTNISQLESTSENMGKALNNTIPNEAALAESALQKASGEDMSKDIKKIIQNIGEDKGFDAKSFLKTLESSLRQTPKVDMEKAQKPVVPADRDANTNINNVNSQETSDAVKNLRNEVDKLFIKAENLENDKTPDIENNIKTMSEKLQSIKEEVLNLNLNNRDAVLQQIDNVINQLKFINDIKSFGYFIPIPFKLNGTLEQADLYVLKRNKNKKVNPEDATVFLALDTSNMGRVETLLVINKRNISLNVRIEAKEYEDYIRTRFVDLYNILSQQGYKLTDIKYRQINEPINVFNVNKVVNDLIATKTGGLDVRL